ncbi:TPA: aldehyde dehydrogenase family protein [Candidatus Woesearchaeota archaeon]|nr:aldehyde dehydrogenase family protein [Candidatus Woesearchaeota archaeon]
MSKAKSKRGRPKGSKKSKSSLASSNAAIRSAKDSLFRLIAEQPKKSHSNYLGEYKFYAAGKWRSSHEVIDVIFPYENNIIAKVFLAQPTDVETAISNAVKAFETTKKYSSFERSEILGKAACALKQNKENLAKILTLENGKAIKDARAEVDRAILTFTIAKEEAKRIPGEVLPVDIVSATKGRFAVVKRFPIGPVAGITPFNFPLNLVCHKVAAAIAAGNPIIIKPASKTPLCALELAKIFESIKIGENQSLPEGIFSVLPCKTSVAEPLITDERIKLLTFTGSADVGWNLKNKAGKKKVTLELGGNAALIVHDDADVELAASRVSIGGFAVAGQSCISVQRIYVHEKVFDEFTKKLVTKVKALVVGDPLNDKTDVASMVDVQNAQRVEQWVNLAVKDGGKLLFGGKRDKNVSSVYLPTILANVPETSSVCIKEIFGPVVVLQKYKDFKDAIKRANNSLYGLQAGIFTKDIDKIMFAFNELDVGGVMVNEVPTYRVDNQPYGGVKNSGFGREGPKYVIEEMTELKVMIVNVREP